MGVRPTVITQWAQEVGGLPPQSEFYEAKEPLSQPTVGEIQGQSSQPMTSESGVTFFASLEVPRAFHQD